MPLDFFNSFEGHVFVERTDKSVEVQDFVQVLFEEGGMSESFTQFREGVFKGGEGGGEFVEYPQLDYNIFEAIFFVYNCEVMVLKVERNRLIIFFLPIGLEDAFDEHYKNIVLFIKHDEEVSIVGVKDEVTILPHHILELAPLPYL